MNNFGFFRSDSTGYTDYKTFMSEKGNLGKGTSNRKQVASNYNNCTSPLWGYGILAIIAYAIIKVLI